MAMLTPEEFAAKWASRLATSTEEIRKKVQQVSDSPPAMAARKKDKWVAKMTAKETQDKWAANASAVSREDWIKSMVEVGIPRISSGVEKAKEKQVKFGQQLLSYQASNLSKIYSMPDLTYDQTKARMNAWFDIMKSFRYKK